jgi:quercetin dioxygenase-like cupin family protein
MNGKFLASLPIHLGLGSTAEICPPFNGEMAWYEAYGKRHEKDGMEGRLVSMHTFEKSWDMWEMHPSGCEVVLCTAGAMTLHQENSDGHIATIELEQGQYAINRPGVWHTADVQGSATAVFITAGLGTQHRPR